MHKVGVIGLGSIAHNYGKPEDSNSYCHVGGILYSKRVELAAVADLLPDKREKFREKWGAAFPNVHYYDSAGAMMAGEELDIVAVCSRGPHHYAVATEVIEAGTRAIFLEKPPSCSLTEMDRMVAAARAKNTIITVSYSRHWSPRVLRLQELVSGGLIGDVKTVVGYVGGPVLSFAGHVTDQVCQFAGYRPRAVLAHGRLGGSVPEGYEPEPVLDNLTIEFDNGVLGVHIGANSDHTGFYADVFGTEGRARAGIYIPPFAANARGEAIDLSPHGMPADRSVFSVAYEQIADYLDGGPLPHCTDADWHAVHEIGFAAIESIHSGRRIELPNCSRTRKVFANG